VANRESNTLVSVAYNPNRIINDHKFHLESGQGSARSFNKDVTNMAVPFPRGRINGLDLILA
jgi:hypothetical protein